MTKVNCAVSVIMPVYNAELFVREAIDSILHQTFTDFEFIIIDDASTDNTWDIIQSYTDKRIFCLRNERNQGNYPSRNRGMDFARGKYIAVMDGDDVAMPERLEKQYKYLEENTQLVAVGTDHKKDEETDDYAYSYPDICISLLKGFYLLHPSLMVKTHVIRSLGGYNERYRYAADYDLVCRLTFQGKIEFLPDYLMLHRKHDGQISECHSEEQNRYAAGIRKKYQLLFINHYKQENQASVTLAELGVSSLGMAIAYYTYARYTQEEKYETLGDSIVDIAYKITTKELPLTLTGGLCGLGCGLVYMLRNGFLEGDEEEVLGDIDRIILNVFTSEEQKSSDKKEDMLFYLNYRNLM